MPRVPLDSDPWGALLNADLNGIEAKAQNALNQLGLKADLTEDGQIVFSQIGAVATAVPGTVPLRTSTGGLVVAPAATGDEAPTKAQVDAALAALALAANGAVVRNPRLAQDTQSTDADVWHPLSSLGLLNGAGQPDAATDQVWMLSLRGIYEASVGGGLSVRMAPGGGNNKLSNPSGESGTNPWVMTPPTANLVTSTAGVPPDGSAHFVVTSNSTATLLMRSEKIPALPGEEWSAAAYFQMQTATARNCRIDVEYFDAAGVNLQTDVGAIIAPTQAAYSQATNNASIVAPAGTAFVAVRLAVVNTVAGDSVNIDKIQLNKAVAILAYDTGGASGAGISPGTVDILGEWTGLNLAPTLAGAPHSSESYGRLVPVRYGDAINLSAASSGLTQADFGGLGAGVACRLSADLRFRIRGAGITAMQLVPEFKQRVGDATPTIFRALQSQAIWSRVA